MAITLKDINEFFGFANLSEFRKEWTALSESDREQIKSGLESGTLTY